MQDNDSTLFKPRITALLSEETASVFLLICAGYFSYLFVTAPTNNSMKAFLAFLGIGSFLFGYYFLSLLWKTRLIISSKGILYQETLLSIYCDWPHIQKITISEDAFVLRPDENIKSESFFLVTFLRGSKKPLIPIHLFVKNWKEPENWQRNDLLKAISYHLPGTQKDVLFISAKMEQG